MRLAIVAHHVALLGTSLPAGVHDKAAIGRPDRSISTTTPQTDVPTAIRTDRIDSERTVSIGTPNEGNDLPAR
jgi:hypothetical protein